MVGHSLSALSPLPSNSCTSSGSLSYSGFHRSFNFSPRNPNSLSHNLSPLRALNLFPSPSSAPEQFLGFNSTADFLRFRKGSSDDCGLQTPIVSYRKKFPGSPLRVDLVTTIHIGDKEYYATLQKELELYDCVLYELVASRESFESCRNCTVKKRLKSSASLRFDILEFIQRQMARILTLDFQLDCLDYYSENWHHADLDLETFQLLQLERGENLFTYARDTTMKSTEAMVPLSFAEFKAARDMKMKSTEAMVLPEIPENLDSWRPKLLWASRVLPMPLVVRLIIGGVCADVGGQALEYPELDALSRLDFSAAMKVLLAKFLTSEFTQETADVAAKSVIIGERNKVAIEALRRAIDEGHSRIAILYGGEHMPDLGRRLTEEFDLLPSQVQWITAWAMKKRALQSSSVPFLKTMAEISGWPLNRYQTLGLLIFSPVLALDVWFWKLLFGSLVTWFSQTVLAAAQLIGSGPIM